MKIIYFHQYFNTPKMSGSTRSYEFAKRLVKMGHKVVVITTFREPHQNNKWFKTNESGILVHWLPLRYSNHLKFFKRLIFFIMFAWKAYLKASKIKGDIVFASSTPLTISLPAILAAKKFFLPVVFEVRDLWPDIPIAMKILKNPILIYLAKKLEAWSYKNSNSIIALSPEMKKGIVSKNINPNKIAIIPNSCDLKEFEFSERLAIDFRDKRPWLNNKPLLVYTGSFGRVNNLSYAVKLAKALIEQNSDVKILLIGDGIEKKKIIHEAKEYNVYEKNLFFEKPIPKKEMRGCLSAATMAANFVIDIRENWANSANKFFDCLAAGKPIFLNHGGWMQDLVLNHNCGLCAYGKSIDIVAKDLNSALLDEKWLISSGNSSIKLAKNYFDRNIHAQQLDKVLTLTKENKINLIENVTNSFFQ
tara:strand:- start:3140 stop:4393 length:1254 start_codon:yes stop_codon:yes gene_type:complete